MAEWRLDLIANTDNITAGLGNLLNSLTDIGEEAVDTGKKVQTSFNQGGQGVEHANKSLRDQFVLLGKMEIETNKLRSALRNATDPKVVSALTAKIKEADVSIDGLKRSIDETEDATLNLSQTISQNNKILEDMKLLGLENTKAYKDLSNVTKALEQEMEHFNKTSNRLRTTVLQNKNALAEMARQGKENTKEFRELSLETAKLQNQIEETDQRIKFFASDTRHIDGLIAVTKTLTATFAIAQGASALFGAENENVQKALLKVNAAMAILNGLQEIQASLQKASAARITIEIALQKIKIFFLGAETFATLRAKMAVDGLTAAEIRAAAASRTLKAALMTSGIGAIIVLLGFAASAMGLFDDEVKSTVDHIKELNRELERNQRNLKYNIDKQILEAKRLGKSNEEIRDIEDRGRKRDISLLESDLNSKRTLMEAAYEKARIRANKESVEAYEKSKEDYDKAQDALVDALYQNNLARQQAEIDRQEEERDRRNKDNANALAAMKDGIQKELDILDENYRKEREEAEKQGYNLNLIEEKHLQARANLIDKYEKERIAGDNANRIAAMKDGLSKELALLDEGRRKELEDAEAHGFDLVLIERKYQNMRFEVIKEYQERIRAANNANRLFVLEDGFEKEMLLLEEQQRIELDEATKNGYNLNLVRAKFEAQRVALTEQFAKRSRDIWDASEKEDEQNRKETQKAMIQSQLDFIDDIEEIRKIELDMEFAAGNRSIKEAKRIAEEKLKIEIEAAKERLKIINPDSVEGKRLQQAILDAQNAIRDLGRDDNPLISALGLDNFSEGDLGRIKEALKTISESIKSILTDFTQSQIEQNEKERASIDKQIENTKKGIEKQKELAEDGRANNLAAEEENLKKLEATKMESIERFKKLQKQQILIDSATQISSLITAAANIFASTSKIPVIGVPLAVAAIASMFLAFAASKARAVQQVNQQTFKKGGLIKGKRHNDDGWGGEKYVSEDGNSVRWIEDGEWVTNRKSSRKYRRLLEAINNDNLKSLLDGTGVILDPEKVEGHKQLKQAFEDSELRYKIQLQSESGSKEIKGFRNDFNSRMDKIESKSSVTYKDGYKIETRGNRTIRTKLNGK